MLLVIGEYISRHTTDSSVAILSIVTCTGTLKGLIVCIYLFSGDPNKHFFEKSEYDQERLQSQTADLSTVS